LDLAEIEGALTDAGLAARGAFHPAPGDGVPVATAGSPARTVVLAGNAGPRMWERFSACRGARPLTLDAWSETVLGELAARLEARAVFPFQRPWLPFQRWAMAAEPCHPSPLGLLVHPRYGLWHAYRGALLFAARIELPQRARAESPCATCVSQPCLSACPAGAFSPSGYDVPACARHLARTPEPACMDVGCLARHACPVGGAYRYAPGQARFHMQSFLRKHHPDGAVRVESPPAGTRWEGLDPNQTGT
jgi:ferredoxin